MAEKTFDFPVGCNARSITLRETNGLDEHRASAIAETQPNPNLLHELIKLSIVKVDGEKVIQPYNELDTWNSRTRALVRSGWEAMNELKDEEVEAFLESGRAREESLSETETSEISSASIAS